MDYTATAATTVQDNPKIPDPGKDCILQLYCDLSQSQDSANGLFADDTTANPSKVWQFVSGGSLQTVSDDQLVVPVTGNNHIKVTISFNMNGWSFADMAMPGVPLDGSNGNNRALRLTIVIGRNTKRDGNAAIFASPFKNGVNGSSVAVFDGVVAAASLSGATPSFTFPLGIPALNSNSPGKSDNYKMLIAITGNATKTGGGSLFFTDGHDPEMEISM